MRKRTPMSSERLDVNFPQLQICTFDVHLLHSRGALVGHLLIVSAASGAP